MRSQAASDSWHRGWLTLLSLLSFEQLVKQVGGAVWCGTAALIAERGDLKHACALVPYAGLMGAGLGAAGLAAAAAMAAGGSHGMMGGVAHMGKVGKMGKMGKVGKKHKKGKGWGGKKGKK